jgi:hypothetical protein
MFIGDAVRSAARSAESVAESASKATAGAASPPPDQVEDVVMEPLLFERKNRKTPEHDQWKPMALEPGGQFELRTRSYAPWSHFGGGFEGDQRGPTTRLDVTSRITQKTLLDTRDWKSGGIRVIDEPAYSDPTFSYVTGALTTETPSGNAELTSYGDDLVEVRTNISGKNPLLPESVTPAIDVSTNMRVFRQGDRLQLTGFMHGDRFPNAELLVTDAKGQTLLLDTHETAGTAFTALWGDRHLHMGRTFDVVVDLDDEGNFERVWDNKTRRWYGLEDWNVHVLEGK